MRRHALAPAAFGVALLALVTLPGPALAQTPDAVTARAIFDEATKALDQGDWATACPRFDASFSLKPTVSALLNIAKCHDHAGKLTLAADDYHRALALNEDTVSQTRKKELAEFTGDALRKLEGRIPRLRIVVRAPPAELRVTRDGQPLSATALDIPLPVDPGEHVVVASAPGRKTETWRVTLGEGKETLVAMDLAPAAEPEALPAPLPAATPPVVAPLAPVAPPPPLPPPAPPQREGVPTWAWIGGAAGLALGGVAVAFAVDGAGANCGGPCTNLNSSQAQVDALNSRRHRDLGLGLALGGVGVAGLVVSVVGIATAPRARPVAGLVVRPWLGVGGAGLQGGF